MRRIKLKGLLLFASAVLLLAFAGCKDKNEPEKDEFTRDKTAKVTFRLTLPQGEAFTYRTAVHDKPEWTVKKLTMYTFTSDGAKLVATDHIDMQKLISTGEAAYSYTKEFNESSVGVYRFLFVANDDLQGVVEGSTSQADLEKLLMSKQLADNGSSKQLLTEYDGTATIPMTGIAKQGSATEIAVTGTTSPVSVVLTRVVARIDIANYIPNLNITKLSIKNTYNCTSAFPTKDADGNTTYFAPTAASKVTMSSGYTDLPVPFKGIVGNEGNELKKAFYLYEGPQPTEEVHKDQATTIVVEGTLENGRQVKYLIPFVRSSANYSPLAVKRNYLYKLILGDNTPIEEGSKLIFTVEDTPWNSVILNHEIQILSVLVHEIESEEQHYDRINRTFYLREGGTYKFYFKTILAGHTKFTVQQVDPIAGQEATIAYDESSEYWKISVPHLRAPMDKYTAIFEVWSDAAPSIKRQFKIVVNKEYTNPDWK